MSFAAYPSYKDSRVDWLGNVPAHWQILPTKRRFRRRKDLNTGMVCNHRLALTMGGVIPRSIDDLDGLQSSDFEGYQIFEEGDLAFKLIDLQNIKTSRVGLVPERGIMSPAYVRLEPLPDIDVRFAYWYFMALYWNRVFNTLGGGVRQTLGPEELLRVPLPLPPVTEQQAIAAFLGRETAKIDSLVAEQRRLIELLREKRQAVISQAVTKGLDPTVPMKDSGVEWLGEVPAHWEVKAVRHLTNVLRGKFTHRPRNDPALYNGDYPFIQTGDITGSSKYITKYHQTLNERGIQVSREFPAYTLVMAIAANIGDVAILTFAAYFPDSIVGLVPSPGIELDYVYYLMTAMKEPMLMTATVSTQMNLNVDQITSLIAPCPPASEQRLVVQHLNEQLVQLDELTTESQSAISLLQERRAALISAAVTGKIDVRTAVSVQPEAEAA